MRSPSGLFDVASMATIATAFGESPTPRHLDDAELILTADFDALDQATTDNLSHGGLVTLEALVAAIAHPARHEPVRATSPSHSTSTRAARLSQGQAWRA